MALTTIAALETHPAGAANPNDIVNANWALLDDWLGGWYADIHVIGATSGVSEGALTAVTWQKLVAFNDGTFGFNGAARKIAADKANAQIDVGASYIDQKYEVSWRVAFSTDLTGIFRLKPYYNGAALTDSRGEVTATVNSSHGVQVLSSPPVIYEPAAAASFELWIYPTPAATILVHNALLSARRI